MKIIVVDDDKIIRMGLIKILKRLFAQHEIIGDFQNGQVALDYLKKNEKEVDLVITDIKMPIMTGIELIEKSVDELQSAPTFVVLSGYDEFSYVRDSMKSGAFNYLLKPIKQEDLKNVISEVEINIQRKRDKEKIINKSIDILKKDFFKSILFSNRDISNKNDKKGFNNFQLDKNSIYKMLVISDGKENTEKKSSILTEYIKGINRKFMDIDYVFFNFEQCIYLIFYFKDCGIEINNDKINFIINETDLFLESNHNVFILETIEDVFNLREQSKLIRKMKNDIVIEDKVQRYYLEDSAKLYEVLNITESDTNTTAIKLAKDYIIKNFNKNITLKDTADEVYLSQNYLSELFKKEIGQGFYEFLSNYRIKRAKEMLITTNLKIYEVAQSVGYNDAITFGRAFKKITGTTPNNFRNSKLD